MPGKHLIPSFIRNLTKQVKSNLSYLGMLTVIGFGWGDSALPPITELVSSVANILLGVRLIVLVPPKPELIDRWDCWC